MPNLVGSGQNQLSQNSDLGSMAFQDSRAVQIAGGTVTGSTKFLNGGFYSDTEVSEVRPSINWDFAATKTLDPRLSFYRPDWKDSATVNTVGTATYYDGTTYAKYEENLAWSSETARDLSYLTSVANATTAPDGVSLAYQVLETTDTQPHFCTRGSYINTYWERNVIHTCSMYAKVAPSGRNFLTISLVGDTTTWAAARWNISLGTLVSAIAHGTGSRIISTSITSVGNSWYRVSITGTRSESSSISIRVALATDGTTLANDTYGCQSYAGTATAGMYWWGLQLEYGATLGEYVRTGIRQQVTRHCPVLMSAKPNQPRFDHNPITNESLGLLMENARTNLMKNSNPSPDDSIFSYYWSLLSCVGRTHTRGGIEGTVIVPNSSLSSASPWNVSIAGLLSLQTGVASNASADYRWSFYINPYTWTGNIYFTVVSGDGNTAFSTNILLFNGGVYVGDVTYIKYILPDGTYVLKDIPNTYNSGTLLRPLIYTTTAGNGWNKFWVGAIQYEAGTNSTSYIPTYNKEVRRRPDMLLCDSDYFSSWFNNQQGTFLADYKCYAGNYDMRIFSLSDGYYYQMIEVLVQTGNQVVGRIYNWANVEDVGISNAFPLNTRHKVAMSYKVDDVNAMVLDGDTVRSVTSTIPRVNKLFIGCRGSDMPAETATLNGWIRKFAYFPVKLANAELQEITQVSA